MIRLEVTNLNDGKSFEYIGTRENIDSFKAGLSLFYEQTFKEEQNHLELIRTETLKEFSFSTNNYIDINYYTYKINIQYAFQEFDHDEESKIAKNLARISFGQKVMATFAARNQTRLEQGQMTLPQIELIEEQTAKMQRLLMNGSTGLALYCLNQLDGGLLPEGEKQYFIDMITNYLNQN